MVKTLNVNPFEGTSSTEWIFCPGPLWRLHMWRPKLSMQTAEQRTSFAERFPKRPDRLTQQQQPLWQLGLQSRLSSVPREAVTARTCWTEHVGSSWGGTYISFFHAHFSSGFKNHLGFSPFRQPSWLWPDIYGWKCASLAFVLFFFSSSIKSPPLSSASHFVLSAVGSFGASLRRDFFSSSSCLPPLPPTSSSSLHRHCVF